MKQTAVEWLYETLWEQNHFSLPSNILEQAKAMENEQRGYTKADVIKAGYMGEINYLDTEHIVSYLDEAKEVNKL